ncbi:hypothetical protein AB1N83_011043 [Pleurotus pulmonarius]
MESAVRQPDLATKVYDKEPTKVGADGTLTVAEDVAGIVLSTLQQAARLAPLPYLKEAAELAVVLFDMVQTTSENKSAFKALANDACELVYTAMSVWKDREKDNGGKSIPRDLEDHLEELLGTMKNVTDFAKARASRGIFARLVSHKADAGRIQGYRAQIKDALDRFALQSHITVRDAMSRVQEQQAAILAALQAHVSLKEGESAQSASIGDIVVSDKSPNRMPHSSVLPRPKPTHFTAFANITNNGSGTFNSINGNYIINNSTTSTSSSNSAGGNGWAHGRGCDRKVVVIGAATRMVPAVTKSISSSGRRGRRRGAGSTAV